MALGAEDRIAIMELAAHHDQAIDGGNGEAWASTLSCHLYRRSVTVDR